MQTDSVAARSWDRALAGYIAERQSLPARFCVELLEELRAEWANRLLLTTVGYALVFSLPVRGADGRSEQVHVTPTGEVVRVALVRDVPRAGSRPSGPVVVSGRTTTVDLARPVVREHLDRLLASS